MSVLLIAELSDNGLATDLVGKSVGAVKSLGDVTILVAGSHVEAAANEAASIDGVAKVLMADSQSYDKHLAEPMADLILSLADGYTHIVAPASASAKNIMPRLAALLDVMIISDVIAVCDADSFERPIYAGNAIQKIVSSDTTKVITVRTSAFDASGTQSPTAVENLSDIAVPSLSEWLEDEFEQSDRPQLQSAKTVVSGGRGVGSEDDFDLIEQLADKLGAAVGASRAAVDAGYAPNDWQVGQTGKVVAPDLYVAVGISGAIQHLAGMSNSKLIVAINKDEEAPIFQIADIGLNADLFDAVPEILEKL